MVLFLLLRVGVVGLLSVLLADWRLLEGLECLDCLECLGGLADLVLVCAGEVVAGCRLAPAKQKRKGVEAVRLDLLESCSCSCEFLQDGQEQPAHQTHLSWSSWVVLCGVQLSPASSSCCSCWRHQQSLTESLGCGRGQLQELCRHQNNMSAVLHQSAVGANTAVETWGLFCSAAPSSTSS